MSAIEELLQQSDSGECQIRIKRVVRKILYSNERARLEKLKKDVNDKLEQGGGHVKLQIDGPAGLGDFLIKITGKRSALPIASKVVSQGINEIMALTLKACIDEYCSLFDWQVQQEH